MTALVADKWGRKRTLILTAFTFLITTAGAALSQNAFDLAMWRLFQGVGVGAVSVLSPMYIAEIAPAKMRGKLVSLNQLSIIIGFLLATISAYYFGDPNNMESWRWMFGSAILPAILFFVALFFIPESPRWLMKVKLQERAGNVLDKIGNEQYKQSELNEINNSLNATKQQGTYKDLFSKAILPILLIGFGLAILQQLSGANISIKDGLLNAVFVGLVFLVFTLLAIMLVDRIGRRKLMLIGTSFMALFLFLLAWSFDSPDVNGLLVFIFVMAYIATYAFTLAPVTWVLLSEIFPNYIRNKALSMSSGVLWIATFLVVLVSPYLLKLSPVVNFIIFGVCNVIGIFFVWYYVPEIKGKSLEEIESILLKKNK